MAVYISFMLWFLVKAHPVIGNAFSHILWLGVLGICAGTLLRSDLEQSSPLEDSGIDDETQQPPYPVGYVDQLGLDQHPVEL